MERVYPSRINWQNLPSTATPVNETNLNKLDYAVYQIDGRVVDFDITKADQSDLLQTLKSLTYDPTTGVFVFTYWNGGTFTVDLNIEKIPVSFSMSPQGVITMTTADGTQYTCDVAALIKQYTFNDSTEIDFTTTTDASGNKTVTASLKSGSITGDKLQPNYLADCVSAKNQAQSAATNASNSANDADSSSEDAEAWANGERNGQPVPSTDPAYHNNSKYWSEQAGSARLVSLQDVDINNAQDGEALVYNGASQKWVNGTGMSSKVKTSSDGQFTTVTGGLMQSCVVDLEPIQSGSGTPSPSNVRAISGHTQVNVENCGKNKSNPDTFVQGLLDINTGKVNSSVPNWITSNFISANDTVTLSGYRDGTEANFCVRLCEYDANKTFIKNTINPDVTGNATWSKTITLDSNTRYVRTSVGFNNKATTPSTYFATNRLQIEDGSSATDYEPYNGYTVTINLGGTYYGGTLDAVSGVLTVTDAFVEITASNGEYASYLNRYLIRTNVLNLPTAKSSYDECICDEFEAKPLPQIEGGAVAVYAHNDIIAICNYKTSLADYQTFLTNNPVHVAYKVATPFTIQLTPQTLETLVGQNDVFAPLDGQTVEEVEYREVMTLDDVIDAIPYENVAPDVGTGEMFTYFSIHRYGRVVVLTFLQDSAIAIVEQATRKIFGVLPERFYTKISGAMPYNTIKYTFINQNRFGVFVPKLLEIDPTNGNVYADYEADEGICPMGSLTYILDQD